MNLIFQKTCGRCEKKLNNNEIFWCKECENYKLDIKKFFCSKCGKIHYRTEDLDWWWHGLCRKHFFERLEKIIISKKVLDDLKKFEKNYKKKYGD